MLSYSRLLCVTLSTPDKEVSFYLTSAVWTSRAVFVKVLAERIKDEPFTIYHSY